MKGTRMESRWADWASRLNAMAQNGLTFSHDSFNLERYTSMRNIAAEIMAAHTGVDPATVRDQLGINVRITSAGVSW
jgi:hypothetical protein